MKNILGLDVGQKRIGVAKVQDGIIVGVKVINNDELEKVISDIGQICRQNSINQIVIGLPKSKNNFQLDKIHKFAIEMTKLLNVPIEYVDETLTSKEAERQLTNSKLNPKSKQYKEQVDILAAKMILEQYTSTNLIHE